MAAVPPSSLPPPPPTAPGPGVHLQAITPSDTTVLSPPVRGVWVGGAGNIAIMALGDTVATTISAVPAGTFLNWILVSKIMATNTTATLIVGMN